MEKRFYDFKAKDIKGEEVDFSDFKGDVLLVVNVASKCGFTSQYEGLENVFKKYKDQGFKVLGFPCNQFGAQEPGEEKEIEEFCSLNYGVSFPMFSKVDVNGDNQHPLFKFLKSQAPGLMGTEIIKWNFTKFLINKNGDVLKRFAPKDTPEKIAIELEDLIKG